MGADDQPRNCPKCGYELQPWDEECPRCKRLGQAAETRAQRVEPAEAEPPTTPPAPERPAHGLQGKQERATTALAAWLWVPPLRGPLRYPVLRAYQYICVIFAWLQLANGVMAELFLLIGALGSLGQEQDEFAEMVSAVGVGVTLPFLILIPIWTLFLFLSLRAIAEAIQVYLDIEDNTRASAQALGKLRVRKRGEEERSD